MSLILEALRKSEAERRRAATPSLYSELPPVASATTRRIDPRWIAGLAAALLLAAALWWLPGHRTAPPVAVDVATPDASAPAASALEPIRHLSTSQVPATATASSAPAAVASATGRVAMATPSKPTASKDNPIPPPPVAITERAIPPIAPPSNAVQPPTDAPQTLSDLSPDERKALPPLKISMHLWNPDPAQRFVIIDGNRLREGDRVGDAVLTAIVADGVVLDWNGRRLKLPIR